MFRAFSYNSKTKEYFFDVNTEQIRPFLANPDCLLWIDISEPDDEEVEFLLEVFNLHPLTIEDIVMPSSRPKIEEFENYAYLVTRSMVLSNGEIEIRELNFCLGKNFLISTHVEAMECIQSNQDRVLKKSPIITRGADMLLYSILDTLVDNYFPIVAKFDDAVDKLTDELFGEPTNQILSKIYNLKNQVLTLRRTVGIQADVINIISRGDIGIISQSNTVYFRNIYDHLVRLNDIIGTSRDLITSALEAYVSVVSNRLNDIMKFLTIIMTLMMPATLIASIYGMNFEHMPELQWRWGYPVALALMFVLSMTLIFYFKKKKWL